jgi:aspartyl-tRNA(Asn)/glutamyl-tRNA(Gln) amidotransferase subunit B
VAIREILDANTSQLEKYRSGKTQLFGFFVGQCMQKMKGKANPKLVNDILRKMLEG